MAGLDRIIQQDFSAGMFRSSARERIPSNGAYDIVNGLLDEEGACYKRGGSVVSSGDIGATGFVLIWSGFLTGSGLTTVVANPVDFAEVDYAAPGSPKPLVALGGAGLTGVGRAVGLNGVLYFPGGETYDGATVAAAAKLGDYYAVAGGRLFVASGDRLSFSTLTHQGTGTTAVGSSAVSGVTTTSGAFQIGQVIVGEGIPPGTTITGVGAGTLTLSNTATAAVTGGPLIATGGLPRFDATDFHRMPGGVQIRGIVGVRDGVAIFTTQGVFVLSNVALNLTDDAGNVQQRLDLYSSDLVLWGDAGIAAWGAGLVVPARGGIWVMSVGVTSEAPVPFQQISGPIATLYRSYVTAGYQPGQATVHRGTYFLPILDSSLNAVDLLTCRLDATNARGQRIYPWTRMGGYGGQLRGLVTSGPTGDLLAIRQNTPRILRLDYFNPSLSRTDADGSTYEWSAITRDIPTGGLSFNTVVKLRGDYELVNDGGTAPTLIADVDDSGAWTALPGAAAAAPVKPFVWRVGRRRRFVRFRLRSTGSTSRLSLKTLELLVRASGRV